MEPIQKETLSLNILLNYPIHWSSYQILRDFVQNFYDSKPNDCWRRDFSYNYDVTTETLEMVMANSGFSYDWLLHIGGSSKTDRDDVAGYFGEGFKIASLCAIRDYNWHVRMASRDWEIHVITQNVVLDETVQKELAYELSCREMQSDSSLVINGISVEDYRIFLDSLLGFYDPQNPLFGEKIFENDIAAVYRRSELKIPNSLPSTEEFGNRGALFARYQMLGTLPFDCVVALHPYEQRDRERNWLYAHDILKILYLVAEEVDSSTAAFLLEQLPDKWNALPAKLVDLSSWYYIICQLIRVLSRSEKETQKFRERHPDLLYVKRFLDHDIPAQNRRRQANAWLRIQPRKYRIVMEQFKLLGFPELEQTCEEANGFVDNSRPKECEQGYLQILDDLTNSLLSGFFPEESKIPYRVIRSENAGVAGQAEVVKLTKRKMQKNCCGIVVRYRLLNVAIREECLQKDSFDTALAVYLHERSHIFGGDATQNFSHALTMLIEIIVGHAAEILRYKEKWEA